jgi:hypothetical protein
MEAVLDLGRGQEKWLKSCMGSAWVGGGAETDAGRLSLSHLDGGGGADVALQLFALHMCSPLSHSSFSLLHSAAEASFNIKRLVGAVHYRTCSLRFDIEEKPIIEAFIRFPFDIGAITKTPPHTGGGGCLGQPARRQPRRPRRPPRKQRAAEGRPTWPLGTLVSCDKLSLNR